MDVKCATPQLALPRYPSPETRVISRGESRIPGLRCRKVLCHRHRTRPRGVDSCGLLADPGDSPGLGQDAPLVALGRGAGPAGRDLELDRRQRLGGVGCVMALPARVAVERRANARGAAKLR